MPPEAQDVPGLMRNFVSCLAFSLEPMLRYAKNGLKVGLKIVDASNKARKCRLAEPYDSIVKEGL